MNEWKEYRIKDFSEVIGGSTPSTSVIKYWNGSISWLTPKDLTGYKKRIIICGERSITEEGLKTSSTRLLPKGAVLLTSRAPIGYVAIAGKELCTNQGFKSLVLNPKLAKSEFIYYWLKNNTEYLNSLGTGTTFTEISGSVVKEIEVLLPSLPEQESIVEVVSSLDDKIELLQQNNTTLEQLAGTLFTQWFLEDAIELSEKQITLNDLIDTTSITHKKTVNKLIFLNTSDIYKGEVLADNYSDVSTLPGQAKKTIKKGDILFSEIRPANGRWAYVDFEADDYVVSTKLMVLRTKGKIDSSFIYFYLTNPKTVEYLQMLAESRSGTFPQITYDQLKGLAINIPSEKKLHESIQWCKDAINKMCLNNREIRKLESLRDTLLPRLMSGTVRVIN